MLCMDINVAIYCLQSAEEKVSSFTFPFEKPDL